jgi:hypothetical protein
LRDRLILRKLKVWCLLLLAAVFAHALLPVPEARASGSAFSPSTVEVFISHAHRAVAVRIAIPQRDPPAEAPDVTDGGAGPRGRGNAQAQPVAVEAAPRPGWRCALSQPRAPPRA